MAMFRSGQDGGHPDADVCAGIGVTLRTAGRRPHRGNPAVPPEETSKMRCTALLPPLPIAAAHAATIPARFEADRVFATPTTTKGKRCGRTPIPAAA